MEKVHKLEERLAESRSLHPPQKTKGIDLNRELYAQADRVMSYLETLMSLGAVHKGRPYKIAKN